MDSVSSRRQAKSSPPKKNIKITEIRTYVPLSHDYADLFANLVASLELCSVATELWEIWRDKLRDDNSKHLIQRVIVILSRYLAHPEGRAFSLYQHKQKLEFFEIAEKIRSIEAKLNALSFNENNLSKLEEIEQELNQLAKNCRLEIQRLAKTEIIKYSCTFARHFSDIGFRDFHKGKSL